MRIIKRGNPGAQVRLEYDKVKVGDKSYVFDLVEGRVMEESEANSFKGSGSSMVKFGSTTTIDYEEEMSADETKELQEKQEIIKQLEMKMNEKNNEIEKLKQMIESLE